MTFIMKLRLLWAYFKMRFFQRGGFYSKCHWFILFIILYAFSAFLKKTGMWFKKSIRGKHVFLTGAGSGLGRLVAIELAKLGAKLTIVDINEKTCQTTKNMVKAQAKSEQV
jgi:2-polyprenyl-3-methyl-5-hydroxy-6-metoxy-1,4-benzoquinol methylase